ncbi:MAG: COG1361 S-layer family protein [Candidatus Woesearchaeota archaeon]|nr:COG1361 S-layer family protein [Candidatus Woesearchaeota archaeon]
MKKHYILFALFLLAISAAFAAGQSIATDAITDEAVSISLLNQDPDPAISGDIVEIRLGIENLGQKTTGEYILEFKPEYPFEAMQGEIYQLNLGEISSQIKGNNKMTAKFKVKINKDVIAGTYNIALLAYEKDGTNLPTTRLFGIDVESSENAEIIYIDQVELIPGHITPLTFTINNVGSTPLRDLTFKWENEDDIILPVGSDNTKYIKYIDVGESSELKFDVIASATADPDLYKMDLYLTYDNPVSGEETQIQTKAGIYVGGATDFDVAYSGVSNGEYSFSIANIGSVAASSVTVKIPSQAGWKTTGSSSVIIGNLNEGDYTVASFALQQASRNMTSMQRTGVARTNSGSGNQSAQPAGQGASSLKIEIIYTDSRGNRNTVTKEVPVFASTSAGTNLAATGYGSSARSRQSQNIFLTIWNNGKWIFLGLVIFIMYLGLNKKYKKGKMKDPDYTMKQMLGEMFQKKKIKR